MLNRHSPYLFRPEYHWPADKKTAPFFTVPAWWRRFIFKILTPRAITVYHYYLSLVGDRGYAFPTIDQVAHDLSLSDKDSVRKAIARLVECGFLIKPTEAERRSFKMAQRAVYQRPCPQFTILTLLQRGEINGELYPVKNHISRPEHDESSDSVVAAGMRAMLGDDVLYYERAKVSPPAGRSELVTKVLTAILEGQLEAMKQEHLEASKAATEGDAVEPEDIQHFPAHIKAAFDPPVQADAAEVEIATDALPSPKRRRQKAPAMSGFISSEDI